MSCGAPYWESPETFVITCHNAVPPKGREHHLPNAAVTNAAFATLLTDSDYFYITHIDLDRVAAVFHLRAVALRPWVKPPEGAYPIYTGSYVAAVEAQAIKLQARETRCQWALGNPAALVEEQRGCSEFLAWREQARANQIQQQAHQQMHSHQVAVEAQRAEEARRQRISRALQGFADGMAENQRRQDEERRHQELRQNLRRTQQPLYTPPPAPTVTRCRPDYAGGIRCTTQ